MSDEAPREGDAQPSPRRFAASLRDMIATLVVVGALVAFVAGRAVWRRLAAHPSRDDCAKIVDRYAEQVARAADERPPTAEERAADPTRDPAIERCTRELTQGEADCAAKAGYADELERCLP